MFEQSLTTPNAHSDKYLRGDKSALSNDELRGYQWCKSYGCVACHQGVNVGGNTYQNLGVMGDYFAKRSNPTDADLRRYNLTKNDADKHVFEVPSLRNVAVTAPHLHDGSAKMLAEAVEVMYGPCVWRDAIRRHRGCEVCVHGGRPGRCAGRVWPDRSV